MSSKSPDYGWKRFWCPRGGTITLDSRGFLQDPGHHTHIYNLISTQSLAELRNDSGDPISCLILLGEPGIGKTKELERLYEEERKLADDNGDFVLKYNLGNCTDAQTLREKVFRKSTFQQWHSNENRLFLHLDSLDEGLLSLQRLSQLILEELQDEEIKPHLDRLFLRITCRSAVWPSSLEGGLVDLWDRGRVTPYELAPLRRVDVEQAASENDIDASTFLGEIAAKEASAFAIKPVTLNFLISSFKGDRGPPSEKYQIYYEGCRQLCQEENQDRRDSQQIGSLSENQRLVVAGRIAAIMTFANKSSISPGRDSPEKDDITLSDIRGSSETADGNSFEINDDAIRETLDTGLFNARGDDRIGWAHQTYQEFLAAWYLLEHQLETPQILSLITHQDDEEKKLVPQLHETAAWLASKNDELFSIILETDPDVLLRSDITKSDDEQKNRLVTGLLTAYEEGKLFNRLSNFGHYKKLTYDGLGNQILPYMTNKKKNLVVRSVAMYIANECQMEGVEEALANVALDEEDTAENRSLAASVLANYDTEDTENTKERLRPLVLNRIEDDPDDEIKGGALRAVWPSYITTEELLSSLKPKRPRQPGARHPRMGGPYSTFLDSDFEKDIPADKMSDAMQWALDMFEHYDHDRGAENRFSFGWVINKVVYRGWEHFYSDGVINLFAKWALRCIQSHVEITRKPTQGLSHPQGHHRFREELQADKNKKRDLLKAMIYETALSEELQDHEIFHLQRYGIATIEDLSWLISHLNSFTSQDERDIVKDLIYMFLASSDVEETVLDAAREHPDLVGFVSEIEAAAAKTDLPQAAQNIEDHEQYSSHQEKSSETDSEKDERLYESHREQIVNLLDYFENNDVDAWWKLNNVMRLDGSGRYRGYETTLDFTRFVGWKRASEETQERIIQAAERYLYVGQPEAEKHLDGNSFHRPSYAGLRSLVYFAKYSPGLLETLPKEVWERWAATVVIAYPHVTEEKSEIHDRLLKFSYKNASSEVLNAVKMLTREENQQDINVFTLHKLECIVDDVFVCEVSSLLDTIQARPELINEFLEMTLSNSNEKARAYAEKLWQNHGLSSPEQRKIALGVASKLLIHGSEEHWQMVFSDLQGEPEFAKEVISRLASRPEKERLLNKLNEPQKADFYIWLETHFPYREDPQREYAFAMTEIGERDMVATLRDQTLISLQNQGTYEACKQIQRIQKEFPNREGLERVLHNAKANARRGAWQPIEPKYILEICQNPKQRLVRSEAELMTVICESLKRAEEKLHDEISMVQFLWDEKPSPRPKPEDSFSDWIAAHLKEDLKERGIITNREVEIRVGGERTDIHVDAVTSGANINAYDTVTVIIEVKGSWHRELKSAMKGQLVEKYLKDNECNSGIYLVGWFNCNFWGATDSRKKQAMKTQWSLEEAKAELQKQAEELSQDGISVRSFVMDTALRYKRKGNKKKGQKSSTPTPKS